jgi:transposase-like protein
VGSSERRNAKAAENFLKRAIGETGVRPTCITTDKAKCYPSAEHRSSKHLNNGLERDHGHLKQRPGPMRGFKQIASADLVARGHALVQNLRNGFSSHTRDVPRNLRLATAWPQLSRMI